MQSDSNARLLRQSGEVCVLLPLSCVGGCAGLLLHLWLADCLGLGSWSQSAYPVKMLQKHSTCQDSNLWSSKASY